MEYATDELPELFTFEQRGEIKYFWLPAYASLAIPPDATLISRQISLINPYEES